MGFRFAIEDGRNGRRLPFPPLQGGFEPLFDEALSDVFDGPCGSADNLGDVGIGSRGGALGRAGKEQDVRMHTAIGLYALSVHKVFKRLAFFG